MPVSSWANGASIPDAPYGIDPKGLWGALYDPVNIDASGAWGWPVPDVTPNWTRLTPGIDLREWYEAAVYLGVWTASGADLLTEVLVCSTPIYAGEVPADPILGPIVFQYVFPAPVGTATGEWVGVNLLPGWPGTVALPNMTVFGRATTGADCNARCIVAAKRLT